MNSFRQFSSQSILKLPENKENDFYFLEWSETYWKDYNNFVNLHKSNF